MGRLISNLGTCRIGCEVGLDFYERAERASYDYNFQAIHIPYIALHIFPVITQLCQRFRTSCCTVLCRNSTIYVKLLINCKLLTVGNSIKTSGSSGWCEYFNVPMCQTVGLWHTFPCSSLTVIARKLMPNLKPIPLAFIIMYVATYFKFGNVPDWLWGWTRFLRASGASEQRSQFPSYTFTLYCLAYISCYYLTLSAISDITLHCTMRK